MQEHAEELHSVPEVRCPVCQHALHDFSTVCPECGNKVERAGHVDRPNVKRD